MTGKDHSASPDRGNHHQVARDPRDSRIESELAALYLSGAMSHAEREAFESRLARGGGDQLCREEVRRMQSSAENLAREVQPIAPPAAVRERVMKAIEATCATDAPHAPTDHANVKDHIWRGWSSDDHVSFFTLRAADGDWEETGVAGVQVRRLFVDRPGNRMTAMFRMAAGTEYPEHVHDGPEECYVLQGDLHVGDDFVMNAGDYQRALPGSEHGRQWTKTGCLLLVTCSLSDEMM